MAFSALSSLALPLVVAIGGLGALLAVWLIRLPRLAIGLLFFSLLTGQLVRLPLPGQGGGLLPSDLAVAILLLIVGIKKTYIRSADQNIHLNISRPPCLFRKLPPSIELHHQSITNTTSRLDERAAQKISSQSAQLNRVILWLITPFIIWSLFTLILHAPNLGLSNVLVAFSYWLRLSANLLLLPALIYLLKSPALHHFVWYGLNLTVLLLVSTGLAQLAFFPDLSLLARAGWDPHQFRLVSTWLDPNFIGLFLVLALPMILLWQNKTWRLPGFILVIIALITTQSRSTQVAAGAAAILLSPLFLFQQEVKSNRRRLVTISAFLGFAIIISTIMIFALGPRLSGLLTIDPTVELRLASLANGWQIVRDNPLLGVGYNAYQFAPGEAQTVANSSIPSRAGVNRVIGHS